VNVSGEADGDGYGHGTFLAGLIAANGATSDGAVRGVAPGARLLDVQVAGADGSTSLLRVLAGLEAVAERQERDPTLRVVNLSLSSGSPLPFWADPLNRALEALWDRGLVVVVAAGNDGPRAGTVSSPGNDPVLLTAGALDEHGTADRSDDAVARFSAHGRIRGTGGVTKPDLLAPGVSVVGLRAPGSVVDRENPAGRVGESHFRGSGTSMAAAVTSAAAAALLSEQPQLAPDEVKDAFVDSAYAVDGRRSAVGAGGLDLVGAAAAARTTENLPPAVVAAWEGFAAAWAAEDFDAAREAWAQLPPGLRQRAALAWATAVASDGVADADEVALARRWARQLGGDAQWLARAWSARAWSADDWTARAWSARAWSARAWSARAWSARAWSARAWSARAWSARAWSARAWSARAWSGDDWVARAWSSEDWVARAWSARAWSARAWSAEAWGDAGG
jgi:serine protease AprX